ncbi:MAG: TIGR00153 family protein [Phycisphaerales bacterium]|nr:TIGR00153 family protein [Phycisphaerales bacterium]MCB9862639.1 TIGR00153 family protein [Phycisphaerales bacterium]
MVRISTLFEKSPFEPLLHHYDKVRECVDLVRPMFKAVRDEDYEGLEKLAQKVFKTEHEADLIKDEIRQEIPRSFFLPVYRGDLLGYLKLQDDVADAIENIAYLLTLKRLKLPAALESGLAAYLDSVMDADTKAREMNQRIRDLVQKGFHASQAGDMFDLIRAVERAEWEADKKQYEVSKALFKLEDSMKPSDLMLWWRILLEMGEVANHIEKMADRLRRMLSQ